MIYRLAKRKKLHAEINVVPYIDVMLVLLIIFMVLSPLLIQGIEVNLPQTDTTKMSVQNEPLVISIDSNGNYYLNLGEETLPFVEVKDIISLGTEMVKLLLKEFVNHDVKEIPELNWHKAMEDYGCDKPDLRIPLKLIEISENLFRVMITIAIVKNYLEDFK